MAGRPAGDADASGFVRAHAADLHRTATMLTGDSARAQALLASVLTRSGRTSGSPGMASPAGALERARAELAREFVRAERRQRRERVTLTRGGSQTADPGEVLAGLRPLQRAATVLSLAHGWDAQQVGRAIGVRPGRVASLVPRSSGLPEALEGVADRHALTEPEVAADLQELIAPTGSPTPVERVGGGSDQTRPTSYPRRPWRVLAAAGLAMVLAGTGWALTRNGATGQDDGRTEQVRTGPSLAERGWVLTAKGDPPMGNEGMRLLESIQIDYARASAPLQLAGGRRGGHAKFAVLWCDLPPVDDPHLAIPEMTLSLPEAQVRIPCAGRAGFPAVRQLTALPYGVATWQTADVSWSGDLPGKGRATLAFYTEVDDGYGATTITTSARSDEPAPVVAPGSAVLDADSPRRDNWMGQGQHHLKVEVGHDSQLTAWVGSSMALGLAVDGIPVTDDGDLGAWLPTTDAVIDPDHPALEQQADIEANLWRTQEPDLRQGLWTVYTPAQQRTFALPEEVRPAPGERHTVVVSATAVAPGAPQWQVQVSDAEVVEPSTAVLARSEDSGLSPLTEEPIATWVGGYRFVSRWEVPADGTPYELESTGVDPEQVRFAALGTYDALSAQAGIVTSGTVEIGGLMTDLPPTYDVTEALSYDWFPSYLNDPSLEGQGPKPDPDAPLTATFPPLPHHPVIPVLAYERVPYEEFAFDGAPRLASSWSPGDRSGARVGGGTSVAAGRPAKDGTVTFPDLDEVVHILEVTTKGKGRLRVLQDGAPLLEVAPTRDGWWSSWTEEEVVSEIYLPDIVVDEETPLTLEVEGSYVEHLHAELLRW